MRSIAALLIPTEKIANVRGRLVRIHQVTARRGQLHAPKTPTSSYLELFAEPTMQLDATSVADKFGVDPDTARRHLKALVRSGELKARRGWWKSAPVYYQRR
jgi:predicted ArsR family transcriptional regulator